MKLFLDPEDSNFFGGFGQSKHEKIDEEFQGASYRKQERQGEPNGMSTRWSRFKIKAKALWGKVKPVINGITAVLTAVTPLMKAATKFFKQYNSMKRAMA